MHIGQELSPHQSGASEKGKASVLIQDENEKEDNMIQTFNGNQIEDIKEASFAEDSIKDEAKSA